MYLKKTAIGGFTNYYYWSSSQYNATAAWYQYFASGLQINYAKNYLYHVRAVRAF
jgi:hypothetical protein